MEEEYYTFGAMEIMQEDPSAVFLVDANFIVDNVLGNLCRRDFESGKIRKERKDIRDAIEIIRYMLENICTMTTTSLVFNEIYGVFHNVVGDNDRVLQGDVKRMFDFLGERRTITENSLGRSFRGLRRRAAGNLQSIEERYFRKHPENHNRKRMSYPDADLVCTAYYLTMNRASPCHIFSHDHDVPRGRDLFREHRADFGREYPMAFGRHVINPGREVKVYTRGTDGMGEYHEVLQGECI